MIRGSELAADQEQSRRFPAFKTVYPELPNFEPLPVLRDRKQKINTYVSEVLQEDPCTNVIEGRTLFNELFRTDLPRWEFIYSQVMATTPRWEYTKALEQIKANRLA